MNNGRFATCLHILTLLSVEEKLLSSEYIASSININPVLVRKEISNLRAHGFLVSKEGKNGGSRLAQSPENILLSAVYQAVRQCSLLGRTHHPNPKCPVGKQINQHIDSLFDAAESAMLQQLEKVSLADFHSKFS